MALGYQKQRDDLARYNRAEALAHAEEKSRTFTAKKERCGRSFTRFNAMNLSFRQVNDFGLRGVLHH